MFIPQLLGAVAEVESTCPVTAGVIRLTVGLQGPVAADPRSAVVSFVTPEQAKIKENVVRHFCHYVHFFSSAEVAEQWLSKHPGTRLLALDEAWALGREKNATQYGGVAEFGRLDRALGGVFAAARKGGGCEHDHRPASSESDALGINCAGT